MASVERSTSSCFLSWRILLTILKVLEYSDSDRLPQESPHEIAETKPAPEWPAKGAIEFKDVEMRYRPGLPLVLKGLSMSIKGGEKIGVVGRCVIRS